MLYCTSSDPVDEKPLIHSLVCMSYTKMITCVTLVFPCLSKILLITDCLNLVLSCVDLLHILYDPYILVVENKSNSNTVQSASSHLVSSMNNSLKEKFSSKEAGSKKER